MSNSNKWNKYQIIYYSRHTSLLLDVFFFLEIAVLQADEDFFQDGPPIPQDMLSVSWPDIVPESDPQPSQPQPLCKTLPAAAVQGMNLRKVSDEAFVFSVLGEIKKKWSHWPGGPSQSAPRLYNRYNLCPCARPAHVGKCGPGPEFKFSKTVKVVWLH